MAEGHIGSILIDIMPDLTKFREKLRRELNIVEEKFKAHIDVELDNFKIKGEELEKSKELVRKEFERCQVALKDFNIDHKQLERTKHKLNKDFDDITVTVNADADTGLARAKLLILTRRRYVHIGTVFEDSGHVAEILGAMSGLKAVDKTTLWLRDMAEHFDAISTKGALAYAVLGNITGLMLGTTGGVINFGGGIAKAGKALLAFPAVGTSAALGLGAFLAVVKDGPKRLKDLKHHFEDMQKSMSSRFWAKAEEPIRRMVEKSLPTLRKGFEGIAEAEGEMMGKLADAVSRSADDGRMSKMFDATRDSIKRSTKGAEKFADAIINMGDQGRKYLPRLADWFTKLGTKFDNWIRKSINNGDFDRWTEDGIKGLKDMGRLIKDTGRALKGLYDITVIVDGGMSGIVKQTQEFADMVNRDTFQQHFKTILDGARDGARAVKDGVADVGSALGEMDGMIAHMLETTGQAFGEVGHTVAHMLRNEDVQQGLSDFNQGFKDSVDNICHLFKNMEPTIGSTLGLVGKVSETVTGTIKRGFTLTQPVIEGIVNLLKLTPDWALAAVGGFIVLNKHAGVLAPLLEQGGSMLKRFNAYLSIEKAAGYSGALGTINAALGTVKGTAIAAGTAMKNAFIANLPLLAITGVVAAIGAIAEKMQAVQQNADDLKGSLDKVTGAITNNTREIAANYKDAEKWAKAYEQIGGKAKDMWDALAGDQDAANRVHQLYDSVKGTASFMNAASSGFENWATRLKKMVGQIDANTESVKKGRTEIQQRNKIIQEAEQKNKAFTDSFKDQIQSVDQAKEALRRYNGEAATMGQAEINHSNAIKAMKDALDQTGTAFDAAKGKWDGYTDSGAAAIQATEQYRQSMVDIAEAMNQQGASTDEIRAKLQEMADGYVQSAEKATGSIDKAKELAQAYGLLPDQITTIVTADSKGAVIELNNMKMLVDGTKGTISIDGKTVDADAKLGDFIKKVGSKPGTVNINGNDFPAKMTFGEFLKKVATNPALSNITADAKQAIAKYQDYKKTAEQKVTNPVDADTSKANQKVNRLKQDVESKPVKQKVEGDDNPFKHMVDWIGSFFMPQKRTEMRVEANTNSYQRQINSMNGRTAGYQYMDIYPRKQYADGGIVEAFAKGGIKERHVAQIAPAGAYRLWAEPETGGEAYIPLSASKRSRSMSILRNVADRFGYGLESYADGFPTNKTPDSDGNTYNITCNIDAKDLRDLRDLAGFVDMLNLNMKMGVA